MKRTIDIIVNGESVDILPDTNISMNNLVYNPTELGYTQAEYSFTFELPSTPKNDRVLNYANNLSKLNKFNVRYDSQLIASETKIFDGQLVVKGYSKKLYSCNFIAIKVYDLEDIFEDAKLSDIDWRIDFSGATSINSANTYDNGEFYFPFVSYGVFEKVPYLRDETNDEYNLYTGKFLIDEYNRFWIDTFYPSHNMLETVKRCFEHKGYVVSGDAFKDPVLKNIYMSVNLADEQSPNYNVGNQLFGDINVTTTFNTFNHQASMGIQDLRFKYRKVKNPLYEEFNFSTIDYFNIMDDAIATNTLTHQSYVYDPNEHVIVIPADGFYRITLSANVQLSGAGQTFQANQYCGSPFLEQAFESKMVTFSKSLTGETPIEIQLVKNYENDVELIKGKKNRQIRNGNPNDATVQVPTAGYDDWVGQNIVDFQTCYPHEALPDEMITLLGNTPNPTIDEVLGKKGLINYIYKNNETMAYDPVVSQKFICGLSSMSGGVPAVVKPKSWTPSVADTNEIFANVENYNMMYVNADFHGNRTETETPASYYNKNVFLNAPTNRCSASDMQMNGQVSCTIYLKKNDILQLLLVQRDFDGLLKYSVSGQTSLHIEAVSPLSKKVDLQAENYTYNSPTTFDDKLNLSDWFNSETTMASFVDNVIKSFNLQLIQDGNKITLDTKKNVINNKYINYAIQIDDRVNSYEDNVESSVIDYPSTLAVKYKIDVDEWGFERSVTPQSMLNQPDWQKYGDSGYTIISINDSIYATKKEEISSQFSYTWYDTFMKGLYTSLYIPVISKYSYMIPEYSYRESMKHDGYGLSQRLWFRQPVTTDYVTTASYPNENIYLSLPTNKYQGINLSYKDTERSLLQSYFNLAPTISSNMLSLNVRLTPKEYFEAKNGAMINMDKDIYYVSEIVGYNPSTGDCQLKIIKKVN